MVVKFKYRLKEQGWAGGQFAIGNKRLDFKVNYFSDPLGDLLNALVTITPGYAETDFTTEKPTSFVEFDWKGEPEGYEWSMLLHDQQKLEIKVRESSDWMGEGTTKSSVKGVCKLGDFMQQVTNAATKVLKAHGLVGYSHNWGNGSDFPIVNLIRLKYFLKHGEAVPKSEDGLDRTSIEEELAFLRD